MQIFSNDFIGLLKQKSLCSIYYISRSKAEVNPLLFRTKAFRNRTGEGYNVVMSNLFKLSHTLCSKAGILSNLLRICFWHFTEFCPSLCCGNFYFKPSCIFIFVCPNFPHFWASITFKHKLHFPWILQNNSLFTIWTN